MSGRIAFVFPGQGSQEVGMGMALAAAYPEAETAIAPERHAIATVRDESVVLAEPAGANVPVGGAPLERLLLDRFHLHRDDLRAARGLQERTGIGRIGLVAFHVGAHIQRRQELHLDAE